MMQFISFDEWLERNPDLFTEDCEHCGGDGRHICGCGDEHECGHCAGTGKEAGKRARRIYREQCEKARAAFAAVGAR